MVDLSVEIDFISSCPVAGCRNNNNYSKYRWKHNGCGSYLKLNGYGTLRCVGCQSKDPLVDWLFNCGNHKLESASEQGIENMLAVIAGLSQISDRKYYRRLTINIIDMFEESGELEIKNKNDFII